MITKEHWQFIAATARDWNIDQNRCTNTYSYQVCEFLKMKVPSNTKETYAIASNWMQPLLDANVFLPRSQNYTWRFNPIGLVLMIQKLVPSHPLNVKKTLDYDYQELLEYSGMI